MKKLLIIFLITIISLSTFTFMGCVATNEYGHEIHYVKDKVTFVKVIDGEYINIFVHKETRVMYINYNTNGGGMSVMLDREGKPLIWSGNI